jgi:hypothetical protein
MSQNSEGEIPALGRYRAGIFWILDSDYWIPFSHLNPLNPLLESRFFLIVRIAFENESLNLRRNV